MSHKKLFVFILATLTLILILAACAGGQAKVEPPTIYYGEDVCDHCNLIINDERLNLEEGDTVVCAPSDVHGVPPVEREFSILVIKLDYEDDDTRWMEE